jgi:hypothetical protein
MNLRTPSDSASIRSQNGGCRGFVGTVTWRMRLARGIYRFGSDAKRVPGRLRVR